MLSRPLVRVGDPRDPASGELANAETSERLVVQVGTTMGVSSKAELRELSEDLCSVVAVSAPHCQSTYGIRGGAMQGGQEPECSFCGRPSRFVEKMIAGPDIFVCNECVLLCVEILNGKSASDDTLIFPSDPSSSVDSRQWYPIVERPGLKLEDLKNGIVETIAWLRNHQIDVELIGPNDLRFRLSGSPENRRLTMLLALKPLWYELPIAFTDVSLGREFIVRYDENPVFASTSISIARPDGSMAGSSELHTLFLSDSHPTGWTHVADLEEGVKGVVVGIVHPGVSSARLIRHKDDTSDNLSIHQLGSRIGVRCVGALVDRSGAELELLDRDSRVIARRTL